MLQIHPQFPLQRPMQRLPYRLLINFPILQLNHVGMRATGVSPAQRKGLLLNRPLLKQKFVLAIEKEDAESPMG